MHDVRFFWATTIYKGLWVYAVTKPRQGRTEREDLTNHVIQAPILGRPSFGLGACLEDGSYSEDHALEV